MPRCASESRTPEPADFPNLPPGAVPWDPALSTAIPRDGVRGPRSLSTRLWMVRGCLDQWEKLLLGPGPRSSIPRVVNELRFVDTLLDDLLEEIKVNDEGSESVRSR